MNYTYQKYELNNSRACGRDLSISFKQAIEITNYLRNRTVTKAQGLLSETISMKKPIPFKRFTNGLGHKPGMGPGRYPVNACKEILAVLNAAQANAEVRGLGLCKIVHIAAQPASRPFHYGRRKRIKMRRCHIEIVLQETEPAKKTKGKEGKKDAEKQDIEKKDAEKKDAEKQEAEPVKKAKNKKEIKKQTP
jgi:large subunit ribosomal protein L22